MYIEETAVCCIVLYIVHEKALTIPSIDIGTYRYVLRIYTNYDDVIITGINRSNDFIIFVPSR